MPTNMTLNKIHQYLIDAAKKSDRDNSYWHPSEIGGCPRKIGLKKLGVEATNPHYEYHSLSIFENGHTLHHRYQTYFRKVGVLATDVVAEIDEDYISLISGKAGHKTLVRGESGAEYPFRKWDNLIIKGKDKEPNPWTPLSDLQVGDEFYLMEVPFEYPLWHMSGNVDAILCLDGKNYVNDIKSIGEKGFIRLFRETEADKKRDLKSCHLCGKPMNTVVSNLSKHMATSHPLDASPDSKHVVQVNAYIHVLNQLGMDIVGGTVLYEDKNNNCAVEVEVPIQEHIAADIERLCTSLWNIVHEKGKVPKKPAGFTRGCFDCQFCDYIDYCWEPEIEKERPKGWSPVKKW